MTVKEAVVARFMEILKERNMRPNELANLSGITPSTVYSMLDSRRKELSINVINVCMNAEKMNGFSSMTMANGFPTKPCDTKPASPVRKRELNTEGNTYSGTHSPRIAITKGWM